MKEIIIGGCDWIRGDKDENMLEGIKESEDGGEGGGNVDDLLGG